MTIARFARRCRGFTALPHSTGVVPKMGLKMVSGLTTGDGMYVVTPSRMIGKRIENSCPLRHLARNGPRPLSATKHPVKNSGAHKSGSSALAERTKGLNPGGLRLRPRWIANQFD